MNRSYSQSNVVQAVRDRLKLAFSARSLSDVSVKLIAEGAGIRINQKINDSASELLSVDSIMEADVVVPFAAGVYQSGTATVFAGNNTIVLGAAFSDTNYTIQVSVFDAEGGAVGFNKPTNLLVNSFDVYVAADGTLTYICIRST